MVAQMVETGNASRYGNGHSQWTSAATALLRELWADFSASQIGKRMGLSRNSVIGKANRLKLGRKKPSGNGKPRERRYAVAMPPPPPELPPPVIQLDFLGLTIGEIENGECHYPEGDGEQVRFCGQLVQHGSSYCPHHHRIVYFPVSPARRDRDMALDVGRWRGVR